MTWLEPYFIDYTSKQKKRWKTKTSQNEENFKIAPALAWKDDKDVPRSGKTSVVPNVGSVDHLPSFSAQNG